MRSTAQIIDALGGRDAVAELTGARRPDGRAVGPDRHPAQALRPAVDAAATRGIKGISHKALYAAKNETLGRLSPCAAE